MNPNGGGEGGICGVSAVHRNLKKLGRSSFIFYFSVLSRLPTSYREFAHQYTFSAPSKDDNAELKEKETVLFFNFNINFRALFR